MSGNVIQGTVEPGSEIEPRRKRQAQPYFAESYFHMQADKTVATIGAQRAMPSVMQLYFLAASRANVWGHAPFESWTELENITGRTRRGLEKALDTLKCSQVIAPESTHLCVVINAELYRRADKAFHPCKEPSHTGKEHRLWAYSQGWHTSKDWNEIVRETVVKAQRTRTVTTTETVTETVEIVAPGSPDELLRLIANAPDKYALQCLFGAERERYTQAHHDAQMARMAELDSDAPPF